MFGINYFFGSSPSSSSSSPSPSQTCTGSSTVEIASKPSRFQRIAIPPEDGNTQEISNEMAMVFATTFSNNYEEGYLPIVDAKTWSATFNPKAGGLLSWFGQSLFRKAYDTFPVSTLGLFAKQSQELLLSSEEKEANLFLSLFESAVNKITECIYLSYADKPERKEELKKRLWTLEMVRDAAVVKKEQYFFTPHSLCLYIVTYCRLLKTEKFRTEKLRKMLDTKRKMLDTTGKMLDTTDRLDTRVETVAVQKAFRATQCLKTLFSNLATINTLEEDKKQSLQKIIIFFKEQDEKKEKTILTLWKYHCSNKSSKHFNRQDAFSKRLVDNWNEVIKELDSLLLLIENADSRELGEEKSTETDANGQNLLSSLQEKGLNVEMPCENDPWPKLFQDLKVALAESPSIEELEQGYQKQKEEKIKSEQQEAMGGVISNERKIEIDNIVKDDNIEKAIKKLIKERNKNINKYHERVYINRQLQYLEEKKKTDALKEATNQSGWETYADVEQEPASPKKSEEKAAQHQPKTEEISSNKDSTEKAETDQKENPNANADFLESLAARRLVIANSVTAIEPSAIEEDEGNERLPFTEKLSFFESQIKQNETK